MELPDKTKPGAWSELYKDKIAQAKIEAGRYEKIVQGIRTAEAEALRNRYTLQVYEQTNNLQNYPVRLILALNAYDTAKDDAAREAALEKVAEVCSYFDVMRSNLESVYSETRFMEQPEGFISDLNHHNHLASKTNNSDWWYYYEIPDGEESPRVDEIVVRNDQKNNLDTLYDFNPFKKMNWTLCGLQNVPSK